MSDKFYAGTAYIGVVGSDTEYGVCRDSIHSIVRRPGDGLPTFIRATKGYEARQMHIDKFMASDHDFILMLDHDMIFPPDTLEKLRTYGRAYVSGAYTRRTFKPIVPVWFKDNPDFQWPYEPDTDVLSRDRLHPKGASGWGCVLIHREVVTAVRGLLKGEQEILEDDMDIWPYDLERVMGAVNTLARYASCLDAGNINEFKDAAGVIVEEIRPLRLDREIIGSDIRFPFFAAQAGYRLWLDPTVRPGHMVNYPLSPDDYDGLPGEAREAIARNIVEGVQKERAELKAEHEKLLGVNGRVVDVTDMWAVEKEYVKG